MRATFTRWVPVAFALVVGLALGWVARGGRTDLARRGPLIPPGATVNIVPPDGPPVYRLAVDDGPPEDDAPPAWSVVVFAPGKQPVTYHLRPAR